MYHGQEGRRWRRRNMYYLTGQPRWMRFGYSSGWIGNPTGLPLVAQYLVQVGQVPQSYPAQLPAQISAPTHGDCANFRDGFCTLYDAAVDPSGPVCPRFTPKSFTPVSQTQPIKPMSQASSGFPPVQIFQIPKEQEIQMLDAQARMFEHQLHQIKKRIKELSKMGPTAPSTSSTTR